VVATAVLGSVAPSTGAGNVTLVGFAAAADLGTLTPGLSFVPTSVELDGQTGTLVADAIVALDGSEASGRLGVINRSEPLVIVFSHGVFRQDLVFSDEDLREG